MVQKPKSSSNIDQLTFPTTSLAINSEAPFEKGSSSIKLLSQPGSCELIATPYPPLSTYNFRPLSLDVSNMILPKTSPHALDVSLHIAVPTWTVSSQNAAHQLDCSSSTSGSFRTVFSPPFVYANDPIKTNQHTLISSPTPSSQHNSRISSSFSLSSKTEFTLGSQFETRDLIGQYAERIICNESNCNIEQTSSTVNTSTGSFHDDFPSHSSLFPLSQRASNFSPIAGASPSSEEIEDINLTICGPAHELLRSCHSTRRKTKPKTFASLIEHLPSEKTEYINPVVYLPAQKSLRLCQSMSDMRNPKIRPSCQLRPSPSEDHLQANSSERSISLQEWLSRVYEDDGLSEESFATLQWESPLTSNPLRSSTTRPLGEGLFSAEDASSRRTKVSHLQFGASKDLASAERARFSKSLKTNPCGNSIKDLEEPLDNNRRWLLPDDLAIANAQSCLLKTENGTRTTFKDVISRSPRIIVIFIRFFWCALCQTYVRQLADLLKEGSTARSQLDASGTGLVIIGTGNWRMLTSYRKMLHFPFEAFTDATPNNILFKNLGLARTLDPGCTRSSGQYLAEMNMKKNVVQSVRSITRMPFRHPGSFIQLGGEFCFESGSISSPSSLADAPPSAKVHANPIFEGPAALSTSTKLQRKKKAKPPSTSSSKPHEKSQLETTMTTRCVYSHRMRNSRDHKPLQEIFKAIGLII